MRFPLFLVLFTANVICIGQGSFSPQADANGSDAIFKDSNIFRDWAIDCQIQRGLRQINLPDSGFASTGIALYATSKADAPLCVSLGDGGSAVLTFTASFYNGEGADFAVFENGFGNGEDAFLELAHVEVSSNGIDFFRFPSVSEIQVGTQVTSFGNTDASEVHNLAGKYIANYGVPFDLDDIPDTSKLDKAHVTHVKIIDVVGKLDNTLGSKDSQGRLINDPWPTNFAQSGFDLDAVGIIHSNLPLSVREITSQRNSKGSVMCFDLLGRPVNCNIRSAIIIARDIDSESTFTRYIE